MLQLFFSRLSTICKRKWEVLGWSQSHLHKLAAEGPEHEQGEVAGQPWVPVAYHVDADGV